MFSSHLIKVPLGSLRVRVHIWCEIWSQAYGLAEGAIPAYLTGFHQTCYTNTVGFDCTLSEKGDRKVLPDLLPRDRVTLPGTRNCSIRPALREKTPN